MYDVIFWTSLVWFFIFLICWLVNIFIMRTLIIKCIDEIFNTNGMKVLDTWVNDGCPQSYDAIRTVRKGCDTYFKERIREYIDKEINNNNTTLKIINNINKYQLVNCPTKKK